MILSSAGNNLAIVARHLPTTGSQHMAQACLAGGELGYLILILHLAFSLLFSFEVAVTVTVLPFFAFFLMVTFPEEVTLAYFLLETFQLTLLFVPLADAESL